jgi:hypothetical protein
MKTSIIGKLLHIHHLMFPDKPLQIHHLIPQDKLLRLFVIYLLLLTILCLLMICLVIWHHEEVHGQEVITMVDIDLFPLLALLADKCRSAWPIM